MTRSADASAADDSVWLVVVNDAGHHALWPAIRPVPDGWTERGPEGTMAECVEWIDAHWTDMRPRARPAGTGGGLS